MLMIRQSHTSRLLLAGQRKPRVGSSAWEQMMHCKMELSEIGMWLIVVIVAM